MATATKKRSRQTDDERAAKVEALTQQLHAAVINLANSDHWRQLLDVASKFHRYSWRNQVLLAMQAQDRGLALTRVAGFHRWKERGRVVRRGEKGLAILAPLRRRLSPEEAATNAAEGRPADDSDARPLMVVRGFRVEHVWDQSQTDPIPGVEQLPEPRGWISQSGEGPEGLWAAVCRLIEAAGYVIEHRPPVGR
jgi:hypothetical protein